MPLRALCFEEPVPVAELLPFTPLESLPYRPEDDRPVEVPARELVLPELPLAPAAVDEPPDDVPSPGLPGVGAVVEDPDPEEPGTDCANATVDTAEAMTIASSVLFMNDP